MTEELIALVGDLVSERKRLSDSLRKLEGRLLHGDALRELTRLLGMAGMEAMHSELEVLSQGLERLGALATTLVHSVNHERMVPAEQLARAVGSALEAAGTRFGRPVSVQVHSEVDTIDRDTITRFMPILVELLDTLVEYGIEPERERILRGKKVVARIQIQLTPVDDVHRVLVVCDGNGILPPLAQAQGRKVAEAGARAEFEGKAGKWSAWKVYLPSHLGPMRCVPVRIGSRVFAIPAWSIISVRGRLASADKTEFWTIDDQIARRKVTDVGEKQIALEVGSGTARAQYVFDQAHEADEVFIKPLAPALNGNGRFLGVVVFDSELSLVLNPAYLVYGNATPATAGRGLEEGVEDAR